MKYSLRSLMIVVSVLPPLLAVAYFNWNNPEAIGFLASLAFLAGFPLVAFLIAVLFDFPAGSIRK